MTPSSLRPEQASLRMLSWSKVHVFMKYSNPGILRSMLKLADALLFVAIVMQISSLVFCLF